MACIGNSITDGHGIDMATTQGYPAQLQRLLGSDYQVHNYGVSSRTMLNKGDHPYMQELAWRDALAWKPDIAIIKLGTNDTKPENWQYGSEFEQDLRQMLEGLKDTKVYLCTPIPAFKSTWNINDSIIVNSIIPIINKVAKKQKLQVIDLHSRFALDGDNSATSRSQKELMQNDGIHPNEKGAQRIAEIVAEALKGSK